MDPENAGQPGNNMSNVFPRNCKISMPLAVQGDGVYIIDRTGKHYLDASGGAAVSCLGHSDHEVIEAIKSQAETAQAALSSIKVLPRSLIM